MEQDATAPKDNATQQKQMTLALILGALVLIFALSAYTYASPYKKYLQTSESLKDTQKELQMLVQAKAEEEARLQSQETLMARLQERKPDFDLWPYINSVLSEHNLKDKAFLQNASPGRNEKKGWTENVTLVNLKLNGVALNDLVNFLHSVYSSNNLIVLYELKYIRPAQDGKGLECDLTLLSPKPYTGGAVASAE